MVEARIRVAITTILIERVLIEASPCWSGALRLALAGGDHRARVVGDRTGAEGGKAVGRPAADGRAAGVHAVAGLDTCAAIPADDFGLGAADPFAVAVLGAVAAPRAGGPAAVVALAHAGGRAGGAH